MKVSNLDQAEAWSARQILPPGPHNVKIVSADEGSSSNGHPEIEMQFEALDGTGEVKDWLVVIPETYGKVKMLLDAVGIKAQGGDWDIPVPSLKGKQLTIIVVEKQDRSDPNKKRTKVAGYEPLRAEHANTNGLGGVVADDDDLPF